MKLPDGWYNVLKWVALIAIPALVAFWLTVGQIWGLPYTEAIGATLAACGVLLGALLGVSTHNYNKAKADDVKVGGTE
jgi:hypothetical protein